MSAAGKRDELAGRMSAALTRRPAEDSDAEKRRARPPRITPVRITVDLEPSLHRELKRYAVDAGVPVAALVRAFVEELRADQALGARITDRAVSQ